MLNRITKEGWVFKNETTPDEFNSRVFKLRNCISEYAKFNRDVRNLKSDLTKMDINQVCVNEMTKLKEFVNKTQVNYENVYAPLNESVKRAIIRGQNQ